jgi:hypothetical protein
MGTGKRRINSAVRLEGRVEEALGEPVAQVGLVELAVPVVRVASAGLVVRVGQVALAELAVPAVPAVEQEHVPVVVEQEHVPVVVEPELAQVVAQGLVPVAAELVLVPVVGPLRTQSVTAAHHRDPVAVIAVEDLAGAVAETTPEPAAIEGVVAWVAVATAAAAVVAAAVPAE